MSKKKKIYLLENNALLDTHSELINGVFTKPEITHDVPKFLQEKCSIKCISKGAGEANKGNQMFIEKQYLKTLLELSLGHKIYSFYK